MDSPDFRFPHLNVARCEFRLRADQRCTLPPYLGSTLRGAFGRALKKVSCTVAHGECTRCWLAEACTYPLIFEGTLQQSALSRRDTPPHPYIFRPPLDVETSDRDANDYQSTGRSRGRELDAGEELAFEILLMGDAPSRLPYVALAVKLMAENGLGFARAPFVLVAINHIAPDGTRETVLDDAHSPADFCFPAPATLTDYVAARLDEMSPGNRLRVRLLTPVRLRVEGELRADLSFGRLLQNVMRRLHLLFAVFSPEPFVAEYGAMIDLAAHVTTRRSRITWCDLERYSNRQQAKQKLGGFLGEIEYAGDELAGFAPLILAGELLHIGAATAFGLGRYAVLTE